MTAEHAHSDPRDDDAFDIALASNHQLKERQVFLDRRYATFTHELEQCDDEVARLDYALDLARIKKDDDLGLNTTPEARNQAKMAVADAKHNLRIAKIRQNAAKREIDNIKRQSININAAMKSNRV